MPHEVNRRDNKVVMGYQKLSIGPARTIANTDSFGESRPWFHCLSLTYIYQISQVVYIWIWTKNKWIKRLKDVGFILTWKNDQRRCKYDSDDEGSKQNYISLHKTTTSGCGSYEPLVQANFLLTSLKLASKTLTFTHMYFLFLTHENRIEKRRKIITLFLSFCSI